MLKEDKMRIKKLTSDCVDYVWDNFHNYIFSQEEFLYFYEKVEEIIKYDKKYKRLFGKNLAGFWKIFREFRTQKAKIFEDTDNINKHIDFVRSFS